MAQTHYDTALAIRDGTIVTSADAEVTGSPSATLLDRLAIRSAKNARNGLIVSGGRSAVTLRQGAVQLTGTGSNDFLGIGAGVLVRADAAMVIDHEKIETSGAVSSALVAAEGATVRVFDSTLRANGGALPVGYKPHIGPGMMQPPAPLGLDGTARTVLAMSNSRTFLYHSRIEADAWGALSTDATGGNLYLEANDCTVVVHRKGYGAYADFGAHVVINASRIDSGGDLGIIAGKARIDFDHVTGHAGRNGVMIHSVMAFDPGETAELNLTNSAFTSAGPVVLVKSANAAIHVSGGHPQSDTGVLLEVRKNDDPNATKTAGRQVPGVRMTLRATKLAGDAIATDPERKTVVELDNAELSGALRGVTLVADAHSRWTARADSQVMLAATTPISAIDAPAGVTIRARPADGARKEQRRLPAGGTLIISP
ncbi:MAG: hypothetical protein JSS24_03225 [Proteobacteria bacterium]|nr:hypothetical protein [Pseudomonadota bacterium]